MFDELKEKLEAFDESLAEVTEELRRTSAGDFAKIKLHYSLRTLSNALRKTVSIIDVYFK